MKQYVTVKEAFDSLPIEQYDYLTKWLNDHEYIEYFLQKKDFGPFSKNKMTPEGGFLSIGQMIEFLGVNYWTSITYFPRSGEILLTPEVDAGAHPQDICRFLWDAVKAKVEEDLDNKKEKV